MKVVHAMVREPVITRQGIFGKGKTLTEADGFEMRYLPRAQLVEVRRTHWPDGIYCYVHVSSFGSLSFEDRLFEQQPPKKK